jgi:murein DD-endopeptidase MepM/ murein hydrolase activator NlpD
MARKSKHNREWDDEEYTDERGARRGSKRSRGRFDDEDFDEDAAFDDADAAGYESQYGNALVAASSAGLPALPPEEDAGPVIIPGSGVSMGTGFLPARERPLTMRLAVIALTGCLILTGLFAVAPLSGEGAQAQGAAPFEALSGAVVWHVQISYTLYTAKVGDTIESIATKFGVQIGGIYELNNMLSGQEIEVGQTYKIPNDPSYGLYYRPASYYTAGYGTTTYGNSPWNSLAGVPPNGALCGPGGDPTKPMAYQLWGANPGSYWVRGFSWYHNGVDISQPAGAHIHAAQAGEVIFSGWDPGGGGWTIKINDCGHLSVMYCHMETLLVHVHQMVNAGDVIGLEGTTGWSTGPHLHESVEIDNVPVDPLPFYDNSTYNITHFGQAPAGADNN